MAVKKEVVVHWQWLENIAMRNALNHNSDEVEINLIFRGALLECLGSAQPSYDLFTRGHSHGASFWNGFALQGPSHGFSICYIGLRAFSGMIYLCIDLLTDSPCACLCGTLSGMINLVATFVQTSVGCTGPLMHILEWLI